MKKLTIFATVAFSCCGLTSTVAQVRILGSGQPTLAPMLVSDQTPVTEVPALPLAAQDALEAVPNPFDYFDQGNALDHQIDSGTAPVGPSDWTGLLGGDLDAPARPSPQGFTHGSDPTSLPVAADKRPQVVDTIINQAMLGNIANASLAPVYWGGVPQTPNPIAEWLLREECAQGLWANYPQQRAAECAAMWNCIHGHGCCQNPGTVAGPCSACAAPKVRNRYTEHLQPTCVAAPSGSTQCDQCAVNQVPTTPNIEGQQTMQASSPKNIASLPAAQYH